MNPCFQPLDNLDELPSNIQAFIMLDSDYTVMMLSDNKVLVNTF